MSCKDVQKLIYLKENELAQHERRVLAQHLEQCEACRFERDLFLKELDAVKSVKKKPVLKNPGLLTSDIMRSVRNLEKYSKQHANPLDKLLDIFSLQSVRFVFATGVVLIIGFFFIQEITVLNRLNHLEQRLAQQGTASTLTAFSETKNVMSLIGKKNEQVVIDKKLLNEFLKSYGELQMKNRLLLQALEEQAEQSNITWQDGLTEKELESLLESKSVQEKLRDL